MLHTVPADRARFLSGDPRGLTPTEVLASRARFGRNDIVIAPPSGWRVVARNTVRDPMIWFLAGTAVLFAWLRDYAEAAVIAIALAPIIGMDSFLHRRTQASTAGLAGRLAARARVVRDGALVEIPSADIVPGDDVVVSGPEPFPADGVLIASSNVQVDESALTGEALPVRKHAFEPAARGADRSTESAIAHESWAAAGTRVLTGEARVRVVFTGAQTLYGQIVRLARADTHERTPLQQALASLVFTLLIAATAMCVALAVTRYVQGHGALDALLSAVTLAVAALPEEFPVAFTFFLSIGVYRLARRQALVRRAVVVENIGRVTCICTDKTGTLTEGKLQLTHIFPAAGVDEQALLRTAAAASRAESADPMDLAILQRTPAAASAARLAVFPFTEDRRREVVVVRGAHGELVAEAKGAPETIFGMTAMSSAERDAWQQKTLALAAAGHKVIASARCDLAGWQGGEPDRDYVLQGLLAFEDPVRPTAAAAVKKARAADIRVIMVTGDHPATARAIALAAGIGMEEPRVVDGPDLAAALSENRADLNAFDVVARCVPAQKLDLVRALQAAGAIVAVTGDGVNDVPALQGADIGIVMGERGTRSAREVASIVLLDDNFQTIIGAISAGRQLFDNLKLSFAYLLMVHIPLVLTAAFIPFAGYPLLYLPSHIVWLELIIHPTAMLVFPNAPTSEQLRPVKQARHPRFFNAPEWTLICVVGVVVTVIIVFGYIRSLGPGDDTDHARSMAMVALIVASAAITLGLTRLRTRAAIIAAGASVASAIVLIQLAPIAMLLHLSPLHADDWLIAGTAGLVPGVLASLITLRRPVRRAR